METTGTPTWTPASCTLPTIDKPLREAEFADLFAQAGLSVSRTNPVSARVQLRPEPVVAARAAELMMRESACCSFFAFSLTVTDGALHLDVAVPAAQESVLDALTVQARAALPAAL